MHILIDIKMKTTTYSRRAWGRRRWQRRRWWRMFRGFVLGSYFPHSSVLASAPSIRVSACHDPAFIRFLMCSSDRRQYSFAEEVIDLTPRSSSVWCRYIYLCTHTHTLRIHAHSHKYKGMKEKEYVEQGEENTHDVLAVRVYFFCNVQRN